MTQTLTLQPNAVVAGWPTGTGTLTAVGAASLVAAVNDNSDSSYINWANDGANDILFTFPAPALPAGGYIVESVQLRLHRNTSPASFQGNPFWWKLLLASDSGWYGAQAHFKNMGGEYTAPFTGNGTTIQDSLTTQVTSFDDGVHVRHIDWTKPVSVGVGLYPTLIGGSYARLYKLELIIRYSALPQVTVTAPADPSSTSKPTVSWTYTDSDGDPQQSAQVIIVREGTPSDTWPYGVPGDAGYQPDGARDKAWDSGNLYGAATSAQMTGQGLINGLRYYAYVRSTTYPAGGTDQRSPWAYKAFTVSATPPSQPTFTVTADPTNSRSRLLVRETSPAVAGIHPKRYTIERLDPDSDEFKPVRGATYTATARGFRQFGTLFNGWKTADRSLFSFANGLTVRWKGTLNDYTPSAEHYLLSQALTTGNQLSWAWRLNTNGRLEMRWSTSGSAWTHSAMATVATGVTDGTECLLEARLTASTNPWSASFWKSTDDGQTWTQIGTTVTGAGPALLFNSTQNLDLSGYDNHLWGQLNGLTAEAWVWKQDGTLVAHPVWKGQAPNATEFYDEIGNRWYYNLGADGYLEMELDVYDYEAPNGVAVYYEVQTWRDDTDLVATAWLASTPASVTLPASVWRLKDPLDPGNNITVTVVEHEAAEQHPQAIVEGIGRYVAAVSHGGARGDVLNLTFRVLGETNYNKFRALWRSGRTLLLQGVLGRQWYLQVGPELTYTILKAAPAAGETFPIRHAHVVTGRFTEVEMPADVAAG